MQEEPGNMGAWNYLSPKLSTLVSSKIKVNVIARPDMASPASGFIDLFTAEQEHEADILGMKLALAANYSIQGARQVWLRANSEAFLMRQPGWRNYTSFEGVGINHPSWTDRLALIDKEKAALWKAMSAFENGVFFLNIQQYAAAEESFSRVINDTAFPGSYDAWTDLGYARLMQYLDKLDAQDIARFKVSQLVVGSFYARPQTLAAQVRGVDTDLWDKSVAATRRALELNPDSTLAKANLGIAYLLSPTGSNVPEATRYLEQAASAAPADRDLSGANRVSILINSAVALLAGGKTDKALARLAQADDLLKDGEAVPALNYNRALALSNSSDLEDHKQAERFLETYLRTESPASLWWESGYALYSKLSEELKQSARTKQEFKEMAQVKLRPVTSVDLGRGLIVTLSDPLTTVKQKLGETQNVPVVSGTNLVRLFYPQRGVELLATRLVVAIFLRGVAAPPLQIQGAGAGSSVSLLRVGMSEEEVLKLLGGDFQVAPLAESDVLYHFYPEVGVAVRFDGRGRVEEMAIAQITVAER